MAEGSDPVQDELGALGYQVDGDALPPFASEINKELDADVKKIESELEGIEFHIEENSDRIKVMAEHLTNVQQEVTLTQQLVDARKREMETEQHLKQLAVRQVGRVESEIVRLKKVADDYKDRTNTVQTDIFKGNEKLDQFKLEMNWNQEELEQWALAARQKEEDEIALERYKRVDDAKSAELTLEIEKLTVENNKKKQELEVEVCLRRNFYYT
jgi:chromosome segregation ATPase